MPELKPLDPKQYLSVIRLRTLEEVKAQLLPWLHLNTDIGWDIETNFEKDFYKRRVRTCQFGTRDQQFVIDLLDFVNSPDELVAAQGDFGCNLHTSPKLAALIGLLKPFLCSHKHTKIGVNLSFENAMFYWNFGLGTYGFFDCAMVERVIIAGAWPLADLTYFSMEEMMARYYGVLVDKTLQQSFDMSTPLTPEQVEYAALDTRLPLAIRHRQLEGYKDDNGYHPGVLESGLWRICQIENNAIGQFENMHLHGETIDRERWKARVLSITEKCTEVVKKLDDIFIPLVGSKENVITEEEVLDAEKAWKSLRDELGTKPPPVLTAKAQYYSLRKQRSEQQKLIKELAEKPMVGNAMINFDSPAVLLELLVTNFPTLKGMESTDDEVLKNYEGVPVIDALRDYREHIKQITTYGMAWVQEWSASPSNEEGWLSPHTHKLHPRYNQLAAETGRSSSDKPNGQNLPRDPEVRKCFIAPPGYVYVTCDMSGAELRIIAELAKAKTWIDAFARGEDLHSVGCEILFPKEWPEEAEPGCAYYAVNEKGEPAHQKCGCKKHKARREITKAINFFLAYGGVATTLADRIGCTIDEAEDIMAKHEEKFPDIWAYLEKSGKQGVKYLKSFDMYGRRRIFKLPTREEARALLIENKNWQKTIALPKPQAAANIQTWMVLNNSKKKPTGMDKFWCTHRQPTEWEIDKVIRSSHRRIERQAKNHCIQATNASIIKLAMGAGYSPKGMPYLYHTLPLLGAKIVGMVHDELKILCPIDKADRVAKLIGKAFREAAAEVMKIVVMEFEFKIAPYWSK